MKDISSRIDREKGVIYLTERERTEQLIKPILRGRDIKRYSYEWAGLWIINVHNGYTIDDSSLGGFCGSLDLPHCEAQKSASHSSNPTQDTRIANASLKDSKTQTKESQKIKIPPIDIDKYPTLKTYFDKVASEGKQSKGKGFYNRDDKGITPYNLRNCAYLPEFAKPKIVWNPVSGEYFFSYLKEVMYFNNSLFMITHKQNKEEFLLSVLGLMNSTLYRFLITQMTNLIDEGKYAYGAKDKIENLPIPKITQSQEVEFIAIVREIIECKKSLGAKGNKNTRSLRGAEIVEKGGSSASARLELEANKRGSPLDCQKSGVFFGAKGSGEGINPFLREEKDSNNKEELQDLESRLDSLETKLDSMVFSLYGLNDEEIELISTTPPPHEITIALLLIASVESRLLALVTMLCENFELELKEAFRFCEGLKVPQKQYQGKIIYPNMAKEFIAYLDMQGFFTNQKCFILSDNIKDKNRLLYLTAILNSKTNFWYFKQIGATLGVSGYEMSKIFVEKLPVVETHKIDSTLLKEIENLASEILESKRQNTQELEQRLDSLIYQLYGLNQDEINIIESELQSRERERE